MKTTTYSDGRVLTYRYTGDGQLYSVQDSKSGLTYQYSYDSQGRLMASSVKNSAGNVLTTRQTYDANNQLTAQSWQMGSTNYSEVYTYSLTTGLLATHTPAVGSKRTYNYDVLQRLSSVTGGVYGKTYTYRDTSTTNTTTQVAGLTYDLPTDITYGYTYDVLGNIATYTQGGTTYTYTYDAQNQLLKQVGGGKTYTYTYDAAGNILTSSDGTTSHSYTYGNSAWRDLLTAVDGHTISYEAGSGNPTGYYNGTSWTFGWAEGRRLMSASGGGKSISYTYDSEGLRLSKKVGTTEHKYYYAGGKLMRETWGSNTLDFFYDAMGTPYAIKYNGTLYYYITNLQGDVLHIVNTSGTPVVSYTYSPYGKVLSTTGTLASTLGADNPLRYRSYYYDIDSGLYYLQSRYYDPELGRFLNADSYASTGQGIIGHNMFAYCNNNPLLFSDGQGNWPKLSEIFTSVATVAITIAAVAAVVAVCAMAAPAAIMVGGAVVSTAAVAATAVSVGTTAATVAGCTAVAALASEKIEEIPSQTYSVYFLEDSNGVIQYVGRVKDSNYRARMNYHAATRGLTPQYRVSGLSYAEARGLEEIGMIECHTLNPSNAVNNQIHGISPNNKNGTKYMDAACDYLFNRAENALLNLIS